MLRFSTALLTASAFVLFCTVGTSFANEETWRSLPRTEVLEEDSHPHEVHPGNAARFHTLPQPRQALIDVKCSLTGPAVRARIETSGMTLKDWPLAENTFDIPAGDTLWIDVIAVVDPTEEAAYFAFRNVDASRLLWHQCYNN